MCISVAYSLYGKDLFDEKKGPCSISNTLLCGFYLRDDSVKNMEAFMPDFISEMKELQRDGIEVNGRHYEVQLVGAGDYKFLRAVLGLVDGGTMTNGCCKCLGKSADYDKTESELRAQPADQHGHCPLHPRTIAFQDEISHTPPTSGSYSCRICGKVIDLRHREDRATAGGSFGSKNERDACCRGHYSTQRKPYFRIIEPLYYIMDILHCKLRVVPQLWYYTVYAAFNSGNEAELMEVSSVFFSVS